jgi:hypothetical protein
MSDKRSGERTMRHGAPGGCGSALNFARQLPNTLSGIPWASQCPLIQLAPTPLNHSLSHSLAYDLRLAGVRR